MSEPTTIEYRSPTSSTAAHSRLAALAPLLIVVIFAVAYAVYFRWPAWPVGDAAERVVYWVFAAAALGAIADLCCDRTRRFAVPLLALAAAAACLWPNLEANRTGAGQWSTGTAVLAVAIVTVPTAILATLSAWLAKRDRDRPLVPLVLVGMSLSAAPLAQATGSLKTGDASYCFAGAVALISLIAGLFYRPFGRSAGVPIVVLAFVATQLVTGWSWFIPPMPVWCGLCIAIAPLLMWAVAFKPLADRPAWVRVTVALILAALPASVAVGVTVKAFYDQNYGSVEAGPEEEPAW